MFITTLLTSAVSAGEKKHGDILSAVQKGEPTYACPTGFTLSGKMCTRVNESALQAVCEEGILKDQNICEVTMWPKQVCPQGYSYDENTCVSWEQFNPTMECPVGYELRVDKKKEGARCERAVLSGGGLTCPKGTAQQGKDCVSWSNVQPVWDCPAGTHLDGAYCVSYEEYDCSPNQIGSSKKKKHLRLLGEKDKKHDHTIISNKGYTDESITAISMMCKRTNYNARIMTCPPGSMMDGKTCKMQNKYDMVEELGVTTIETTDVHTYCGRGDWCAHGKKHGHGDGKHGNQCCTYSNKSPFLECSIGFELIGEQCVAYRPPALVCKDGKKKNKKGGCSATEYKEPIVTYKAEYSCMGKDCGGHKH